MKRVTIIISFFLFLDNSDNPYFLGKFSKNFKDLKIEELKRVNTNELYGKIFTLLLKTLKNKIIYQ